MAESLSSGHSNAAGSQPQPQLYCSFCGKSQDEVRKLIAGPRQTFICDDCVLLCVDILEEEAEENGRPAYRHCLIHAGEPRYYDLKSQAEEQCKLLEAAEPVIPEQYTALRESIAALLRPAMPDAPSTSAATKRSRKQKASPGEK